MSITDEDKVLLNNYEKLRLEELKDELKTERNIHKKRIIRTVIASKEKNKPEDSSSNVRENQIKTEVHNPVTNVLNSNSVVNSKLDEEIKKLEDQLRNSVNLQERKSLRKQIHQLKDQIENQSNTIINQRIEPHITKDLNATPRVSLSKTEELNSKPNKDLSNKDQETKSKYQISYKKEPEQPIVQKYQETSQNKNEAKPSSSRYQITNSRETKESMDIPQISNINDIKTSNSYNKPESIIKKETESKSFSRQPETNHEKSDQPHLSKPEPKIIKMMPENKEITEEPRTNEPIHKGTILKPTFMSEIMEKEKEGGKSPNLNRTASQADEVKKPVSLHHSATFQVGKRPDSSSYTKEKSEIQSPQEIKVQEKESLTLSVIVDKVETKFPTYCWYFGNRKLNDYSKFHFHKLETNKINNIITMKFDNCEKRNHEGIYRLEIEDKKRNWYAEFKVQIDLIIRQSEPIKKDENVMNKDKQVTLDLIKSKEPPTDSNINPIPSMRSGNNSRTVNSLYEKPSTPIISEPQKTTTVSRVSSMKGVFEQTKPTSVVPPVKTQKQPQPTVDGNKLAAQVLAEMYEDEGPRRLPSANNPAAQNNRRNNVASLAAPQIEQTRRTSQAEADLCVVEISNLKHLNQTDKNKILLGFVNCHTKNYLNVNISNFSTSWANGLAFCALIHHFYPDAFDYNKLTADKPLDNFKLAFDTAKNKGNIDPLIDPDDMMILDKPDWKVVYTYLQHMYNILKDHPKNNLKIVQT